MLFAKNDNTYLKYRSTVATSCHPVSIIARDVVLLRRLLLYSDITADVKQSSSGASRLVCFLAIGCD